VFKIMISVDLYYQVHYVPLVQTMPIDLYYSRGWSAPVPTIYTSVVCSMGLR